MNRINKLTQHLEEAMEVATQKWLSQVQQINTTHIKKVLQDVGTRSPPDSHMVITYLRSSALTESHRFKLAVYKEEPFVDAPIYETRLEMKSLYTEVPNDVQALIKKLSPTYIQILSYEKEEIKRRFTARLYQQSYHFFAGVLEEMETQQQLPVYFGEEVSELITIGAMTS